MKPKLAVIPEGNEPVPERKKNLKTVAIPVPEKKKKSKTVPINDTMNN